MHFCENSSGSDEQFAMKIENGHAVENATLLSVVRLNTTVGCNIIQHNCVVGRSHRNSQGLIFCVQNANIPNPVHEMIVHVERGNIAEVRINEFAPQEERKLSLTKNTHYIICYVEINRRKEYRNGFRGLWYS